MKITYDASSGFVYLYRDKPQPVARTVELAPGIMADYGAGGQLVGIEVWGTAGGFEMAMSDSAYEERARMLSALVECWIREGYQSYGWAYRQSGERIVWHFEDGEWKKVLAEMWENGRRHVV